MKKIFTLVACIFVFFAALLTLSGCGESNPVEGTYYLFENEKLDKSKFITLSGSIWTDDSDAAGDYKISKENITIYVDFFGQKIEYCSGTIKNGVMKLSILGSETVYCKEGSQPSGENGGGIGPDSDKETEASIKSVKGATITDKKISMVVDSDVDSVSLSSKVVCSEDSVWKLYYDKEGQTEIATKIVTELSNGDNLFYIIVTPTNGTRINIYELTIHRSYAIDVTYFNGEEELKTVSVQSGNEFEASYEPTIKGYTFTGWKDKDGKTFTKSVIWEDLVLYADTTANKYTITYDVNKDDGISQTTVEVTFDTNYTLSVPTRIGYSFVGWYIEDTKLTDETGKSLTEWKYDENKTVVAKYEVDLAMSNFDFTSSSTLCIITGVKDTTVTSIVVPNYATSISKGAFSKCSNLVEITLPFIGASMTDTSATYFGYIFGASSDEENNKYLPTSLKSVIIGDSATSIGSFAFSGCSSLTCITIPTSVTSIGYGAFYDCSSLTSITIPTSVTSIGSSAFSGCSSLTSITIPNSVTSIGIFAFLGCSSLTSITIPNSVTSIGDGAFYDCSSLTSITIPTSVTSIGHSAFYDCSSLTSIEIPTSVTSIEASTFYECSSLTSITIPTSVTSIGSSAFYECSSLTSIKIPDKVTSIGDSAFKNCSSLTSITLPEGVTSIGYYAFNGCYRLVEVYNLSNYLTITKGSSDNGYIGYYAKDIYTSLESTSNFITTEEGYRFYNDNGAYYLIGYYGDKTELILPTDINGNNYSIYGSAFSGCSSLTSITIPNSVTSIGDGAFQGCSRITIITIPEGVTSIGYRAFYGCYRLVEVYNLSNYLTITKGSSGNGYIGYYAKDIYTSLESTSNFITIEAGYKFYNDNGAYYLIGYYGDKTELILPTDINGNNYSINSYAFYECSSLTSITIPEGVTSIGEYAFYYCSSLTSITIPNSVESIGYGAFRDCSNLTSITFKNTVGWYVTTNNNTTSGSIVDVSDSSQNATYFRDTYYSYYWYRKVM